jgi:hypothetical protein
LDWHDSKLSQIIPLSLPFEFLKSLTIESGIKADRQEFMAAAGLWPVYKAVGGPPDGGTGGLGTQLPAGGCANPGGRAVAQAVGQSPSIQCQVFAATELLGQIEDRTWLAKVTNALNQYWQKRNAAKRNGQVNVKV